MHFKTLSVYCVSALVFLAAGCARAQDNPTSREAGQSSQNDADAAFVRQAAEGGIAEVDLSQLAVKSATVPELREFAKKMVDDHSANNRELASVASKQGISVPKTMDEAHVRLHEKLSTLRGPDFDDAYIDAMVGDHKKMVALLQSSADTVHAKDLHSYIDKTLPVVRAHLVMAQKLKK